jgi:hypothetical protein
MVEKLSFFYKTGWFIAVFTKTRYRILDRRISSLDMSQQNAEWRDMNKESSEGKYLSQNDSQSMQFGKNYATARTYVSSYLHVSITTTQTTD